MTRSLTALAAIMAISLCPSLKAASQEAVATPAVQQIEGVAATVNDEPITYSDVRERAQMLLLSLGGQQPTQEQIQQLANQALEQLIDEKLQLQEATEYEVEVSDSDIADSINNLARQSGVTREELIGTLLQAGINPKSLEDQTRADIAWRRIMGGLYGSRIRISPSQISDQMKRMVSSAAKEQYQIREIFLFAPDEENKQQALEVAATLREQISNGAPFQVAAQRFSSAPTSASGGDMGWVTLDDLDQARADALSAMQGPGLTEAIVTEEGVYLLEVRGKQDPSQTTSRVDLVRLTVNDGSDEALWDAAQAATGCDSIETMAAEDENLRTVRLEDLNVADLGPEGRSMVEATEVGQSTDIFATSGTLAVMFVCDRQENVPNMPTREQLEDRLFGQQLGMISERSLRNLRREATIIRR
ncbi:SurA N-terminal domain-containing protein [Hyphomonas sp. FCG-A18]|jgi:peptidyl-prolyl cis-trans isomerase SurA|uniref:peptidylprolyl isomerase n=1 Tax=Hyphomonas sp. FCG-A18 TaxID=3080019 RepID=UPI002B2B7F8A|nr:SurA N-terminal domain-containing protein [Hyphomonas sp. FCG-A18]